MCDKHFNWCARLIALQVVSKNPTLLRLSYLKNAVRSRTRPLGRLLFQSYRREESAKSVIVSKMHEGMLSGRQKQTWKTIFHFPKLLRRDIIVFLLSCFFAHMAQASACEMKAAWCATMEAADGSSGGEGARRPK